MAAAHLQLGRRGDVDRDDRRGTARPAVDAAGAHRGGARRHDHADRCPPWIATRVDYERDQRDGVRRDDGLFVARPFRMLLDLAVSFNDHRFQRAAEDAWLLKLITPESCAAYLDQRRRRGRAGVARFDRWVTAALPPPTADPEQLRARHARRQCPGTRQMFGGGAGRGRVRPGGRALRRRWGRRRGAGCRGRRPRRAGRRTVSASGRVVRPAARSVGARSGEERLGHFLGRQQRQHDPGGVERGAADVDEPMVDALRRQLGQQLRQRHVWSDAVERPGVVSTRRSEP